MKISYAWLKEYLQCDQTPEQLSTILTDIGLEVESLEKVEAVKGGLQGVVIGEVLSCEQHPNADKLKTTKINVGQGEPLDIVCGAPNVAAGQKVIVATVGCTLYPDPEKPFKIKKSKIRGEVSEGMLCAEDELGLGESHDGILVLPEDTKVGLPAAEYFGLEDDYLFEIGLTPNRADAMGHIGVARDLTAFLTYHKHQFNFNTPDVSSFVEGNGSEVKLKVEATEGCPRYCALTLNNVKVGPSPAWLQKRLRAIGLSPINNVVDVTNFVMMEYGSPLHAFDGAVVNGEIVVRNAKKGEVLVTLDEEKRELFEEDVLICNADKPMCLAGVFGGIDSGVSEKTTTVVLESAYFEAVSTRQMARRHGLNTDASFRFERGVDPKMTVTAMKRAALLLQEVAGAKIASKIVEVHEGELPKSAQVEFSPERCRKLIGANISDADIESILKGVDIEVKSKADVWSLEVPAYRVDVIREADVCEEVLRIYGFNQVEIPAKLNSSLMRFADQVSERWKNTLSEMLLGMGYSEIMNNSLVSSSHVEKWGGEALSAERNVPILNPLSQELDTMRQSLLFGGLDTIAYNKNRQQHNLRLFEFGKTFHKYDSYTENQRMLVLLSGFQGENHWSTQAEAFSFYSAKSVLELMLERMGLKGFLQYKPLKKSLFEDGLQVFVLKQKIGEIGWPSAKMRKGFGVKSPVFALDLDWDALMSSLKLSKVQFKQMPQTFATRRDFSLLLDKEVNFADIEELAKQADRKLLREVNLFDVYEGDKIDAGKKSYAVSFTFQDDEKTLKDQQVDKIMEKIRSQVESKLGAQLR